MEDLISIAVLTAEDVAMATGSTSNLGPTYLTLEQGKLTTLNNDLDSLRINIFDLQQHQETKVIKEPLCFI